MSRNATTGLIQQRDAGTGYVFGVFVIVAIVGLSMMTTEGQMLPAWADVPNMLQIGKLPEGEITAVGSTTLDVAGRLYAVHPKLTIVNDEGRPMEWKQLKTGMVVQYSVKEGSLDRIIVLMPR